MEKLKRCPFCGGKVEITTSESDFLELLNKNGVACVLLRCWKCNVDMYEHGRSRVYDERLESLVKKWNRRVKNG